MSWLPDIGLATVSCVSSPNDSGKVANWLPERSSNCNFVSCPSDSGNAISWFSERSNHCKLCELCQATQVILSVGSSEDSTIGVALVRLTTRAIQKASAASEIKLSVSRLLGFFNYLFSLTICIITCHSVRLPPVKLLAPPTSGFPFSANFAENGRPVGVKKLFQILPHPPRNMPQPRNLAIRSPRA